MTQAKAKAFLFQIENMADLHRGDRSHVYRQSQFLTANNIRGICESMMSYGVVALGLTICLIAGENNIAIGSVLAFSGMIFGKYIGAIGIIPAFLLAIVLCGIFGLVDGYFVAYHKMPAFLMAVVFMISVRGLALMVSKSQNILISDPTLSTSVQWRLAPSPFCLSSWSSLPSRLNWFCAIRRPAEICLP